MVVEFVAPALRSVEHKPRPESLVSSIPQMYTRLREAGASIFYVAPVGLKLKPSSCPSLQSADTMTTSHHTW